MLVASNRAPIWRCAQSSGPFCGGADADVQTAEQTRRAFIENELSWLSRVVIAVISQEVGQATNQSANIPHPETSSAQWLAVERPVTSRGTVMGCRCCTRTKQSTAGRGSERRQRMSSSLSLLCPCGVTLINTTTNDVYVWKDGLNVWNESWKLCL